MKRRIQIVDKDEKQKKSKYVKDDFYDRWYAKFGKPETRTWRGDEFMKRLKEMCDFE